MKKHPFVSSLLYALLLSFGLLVGCQKSSDRDASAGPSAAKRGIAYYTCSMHPQIRADKPGSCPICGMRLVPVRAEAKSSVAPAVAAQPAVTTYACPMHPEVQSDKPGSCPKCGMDLTPATTPAPPPVAVGAELHLSEPEIRQAGIRTEAAATRSLAKELLVFGTLGYNLNQHRDVVSLVEGRIERQFVDFNQTEVKQGDPLVALYSTQALMLQEEYLKALRERWLSTFYERKLLDSMISLAEEKLFRIGFSPSDLARLQKEKKAQADIIVRSPVSGTIVGNMVHLGEVAKADQTLYHIVPLDELWFNAQVFEPDLGLLALGQKVRISTKSFPGKEFIGRLAFIGRSLDAGNRTILVRFVVPNRDRHLLPNLSASGQIEIPIGEVLSVPNSAVLDLGTRHVVYAQKEVGVYVARSVRIGHVTPHYTQIQEGLKAGEQVVTAGAFLIDAQAQLRGGQGGGGGEGLTPPPAEHRH